MNKIKIFLTFVLLSLSTGYAWAFSSFELENVENVSPKVQDLLNSANDLVDVIADAGDVDAESAWKAAAMYCEAAREGSAEAHYRLGMLYAFGRGVPENHEFSANLFSVAAKHNHFEAQQMLETFAIKSDITPPCVASAALPERAFTLKWAGIEKANTPEIDAYISKLPQNKRWVLSLVDSIASAYKVDAKLVLSIISVESNFVNVATSNKAAQGLMQLIPDTAERFNVKDAYNASQNIKGGVAYLRWLLAYFKGDVPLVVAAYNAGEGAVNKYKGIPPYAETQQYVKKVQARYPFKTHAYDAKVTNPSPLFNSAVFKRRG